MKVLEGEEADVYLRKLNKKAKAEFKKWQDALCRIVKRQSQLVFNKDGTYQFILPPRLVKLVWATTIQERIKAQMVYGKLELAEAREAALNAIKQEMDQAHSEFTDSADDEEVAEEEKAAAVEEAEEADAASSIARLRAEMLKQKGG